MEKKLSTTITESRKLEGYVRMQTEISSTNESSLALSTANSSVSVFHCEQARAAGRIDRITWSIHTQPIRYSISQHGSAASGNTETIDLFSDFKKCYEKATIGNSYFL